MTPDSFIRALVEHGRVQVPRLAAALERAEWDAAAAVLAEFEKIGRLEFPGTPPEFSPAAARWAAQRFYQACQFAVFRDLGSEAIEAALAEPCPPAAAASQHYSVDLVFRFLSDLLRHARGLAENDPLCDRLRTWGQDWPLSSVGIPGLAIGDVEAICSHAGLLSLYVDRIIARGDASRLADDRVRRAVQAALGYYPNLAPALAAALAGDSQSG